MSHSYGRKKGQHTFTLLVLKVYKDHSTYIERDEDEKFRIKGRNLYKHVLEHVPGNESVEDYDPYHIPKGFYKYSYSDYSDYDYYDDDYDDEYYS